MALSPFSRGTPVAPTRPPSQAAQAAGEAAAMAELRALHRAGGSVADIKAAVGDDAGLATVALALEKASDSPRKSLVGWLEGRTTT